jgi:hypothetical protein
VEEQRRFRRNVESSLLNIKVEIFNPNPEMEKMIKDIFEMKPDACIVDYKLNESRDDISYFGDKVIDRIKSIRSNFPCILLTNYESSAENESSTEPFKIYDKTKLYGSDVENNFKLFLRKLIKLIQFEEKKLDVMEKRFFCLKNKWKNRELTSSELDELSQLNSEIEGSLDSEKLIPKEKIKTFYDDRSIKLQDDLNNVIKLATELIEKFDNEDKL